MTLRFIVTGTDCQDDYNVCDVSPFDVMFYGHRQRQPGCQRRYFFMVTGTDCQDDYDACDESPCDAYQTCTDLTPEQQGGSDVGYMCTGCPDGFDVHPVDATRFDSNQDFANMTLKIDWV